MNIAQYLFVFSMLNMINFDLCLPTLSAYFSDYFFAAMQRFFSLFHQFLKPLATSNTCISLNIAQKIKYYTSKSKSTICECNAFYFREISDRRRRRRHRHHRQRHYEPQKLFDSTTLPLVYSDHCLGRQRECSTATNVVCDPCLPTSVVWFHYGSQYRPLIFFFYVCSVFPIIPVSCNHNFLVLF